MLVLAKPEKQNGCLIQMGLNKMWLYWLYQTVCNSFFCLGRI